MKRMLLLSLACLHCTANPLSEENANKIVPENRSAEAKARPRKKSPNLKISDTTQPTKGFTHTTGPVHRRNWTVGKTSLQLTHFVEQKMMLLEYMGRRYTLYIKPDPSEAEPGTDTQLASAKQIFTERPLDANEADVHIEVTVSGPEANSQDGKGAWQYALSRFTPMPRRTSPGSGEIATLYRGRSLIIRKTSGEALEILEPKTATTRALQRNLTAPELSCGCLTYADIDATQSLAEATIIVKVDRAQGADGNFSIARFDADAFKAAKGQTAVK